MPFTTEAAEYNVLQASGAGGGSQKIDVGYLPTTDAPTKPANATVGPNPVNGYTLDPLYSWGDQLLPAQLPVDHRQRRRSSSSFTSARRCSYLMNQAAVITGPLHGYGVPTVGPVGTYPVTQYLSATGKQGDPFPYNPTKAK